ncbi:hypothetical protein NitYY0826_C0513 [Nitratiruptor sp. YY08-26]|uniref:hypothetical protein n=1 Tax=unclassified Nitratiruptor TaxID=2624044 RepID=UPI001916A65E|nr:MULTISPECIES: hypothetical protein [unclassified Nitratiruptor]BCD61652.1 hypothetical protein NitYY0813_C0511 [Nitratiruptor sp. YY08-13]BCD65587.1 hypothetical protein NitYY0826_C0513 [Nitratiruptor sp. YY08-26]
MTVPTAFFEKVLKPDISSILELASMNEMICQYNFDITTLNNRDYKQRNALFYAIYFNNLENCKFLLKNKISLWVEPQYHALDFARSLRNKKCYDYILLFLNDKYIFS